MELPPARSTLFQGAVAVAIVLSPIAVAFIGARFADAASRRQTEARLVELALGILREEPRPQVVDVRGWAMDILDTYSGVRLSHAARRALSDSVRFPGGDMTVDIKANNSDGPVTLGKDSSYTYSWSAVNAKSCQLTSPVNSGIPVFGSDLVVRGSPFFPAPGQAVILTIVCEDGASTQTDAVTIRR